MRLFTIVLSVVILLIVECRCVSSSDTTVFIEYSITSNGIDNSALMTMQRANFLKSLLECYGNERFYKFVDDYFNDNIIKLESAKVLCGDRKQIGKIVIQVNHGNIIGWHYFIYPNGKELSLLIHHNTQLLFKDDNYVYNIFKTYNKQTKFAGILPSSFFATDYIRKYNQDTQMYIMPLQPLFMSNIPPFNQINMRDTFFAKSKKDFMIWYKSVLDSMLSIPVKYRYSLDGPTYDSRERPLFKSKKTKK